MTLAFLLSACGSSSSSPPAFKTYTDPRYHFTLQYPASWTAGKGHVVTNPTNGAATEYDASFQAPNQQGQAQVSISGYQALPAFIDGHRAHVPGGASNAFYHYYHRTMSGRPAMRVELWIGTTLTEIDTLANTHTLQYDLRIIGGINPALPKKIQQQYEGLVASLKIPKS